MYQSAYISRHHVLRRNQNTARYQSINKGLGPISHALFVALLLAIVGLMYLTQITKTTELGYEVEQLKEQRSQLVSENEQLQVEAARLQALERIRTSDVARSLEPAGQVDFVQ